VAFGKMQVDRNIVIYRSGKKEETGASVAVEAPVRILLNGKHFMTLQCSPGRLEEMVIGYFLTEAIVRRREEISSIDVDREEGVVSVTAAIDEKRLEDMAARASFTTGCGRGITFSSHIDLSDCDFKINMMASVAADAVIDCQRRFVKMSELYGSTRGVHSAALWRGEDSIAFADDVGRHNAVDKVIGMAVLSGAAMHDLLLSTSGRPSFDIVLKGLRVGVPFLLSRGAPTSLAVETADACNLTLMQVRGGALKVYTGSFRVK